ncbi:putative transposase, MuDR, plant, MULE transposase domain protein [Tanacetum coccineum]
MKRFQRFFISLVACSMGFLADCHPYISLDACHLKGKFNGVLVAATGIYGNNSIFLVAYSILESENTNSWTWFLESLKKAIGAPYGLVISSKCKKD